MFNKKRKPYTEAEAEFVMLAKSHGCVCCEQLWPRPTNDQTVEFNHHLRAGRRISNDVGTAECEWHHRGVQKYGFTKAAMAKIYGPSRANGSKPFRARFGTDEELRERQARMIRGA